jgi:hypothetical protein
MKNIFCVPLVFLFFAAASAQEKLSPTPEIVASGGTFTLEKTVTAGGGIGKQSAALSESGTTGQTIAGARSTGGGFALYSGFWTPADLAPTAANAVVGGRILTSSGQGIRNVQVTIQFPTGEARTTVSTAFGYYRFADIPTGGIYVISVTAKKYTFSQSAQIRSVQDDLQDVDFVANE